MATAPYVCFITSPERLDVEPVPRPNRVIEHMSLRQRQPVSHRKGQVNSPKESWQTIFMERSGQLSQLSKGKPVYWWLRTRGGNNVNAAVVYASGTANGKVWMSGSDVGHHDLGYRPAMWISVGG